MAVVPHASASMLYEGDWVNTTFDSTGTISLELDVVDGSFTGNVDAEGFVFGFENPGPLNFTGNVNPDGSFTFDAIVDDPFYGDGVGSIGPAGNVDIEFDNIPSPTLGGDGQLFLTGTFDGLVWDLDYVVNNSTGFLANGTIDMVIPEPATVALLGAGGLLILGRGRRAGR